jgi:hypothetical protein
MPKGEVLDGALFEIWGEMDAVVPKGARFKAFESALYGLMPIEPEGNRFVIRESFICGIEDKSPGKGLLIPIPLSS